jgi:PAS domain S-box-containing protein
MTELFSALLESAPDAMLIVNEHGIILATNSQTERLFGYSREELVGQPVEKLMPPRFRESHATHRCQFFSTPRLRPMGTGLDIFGLRRDGSEFPAEISLNPVPTESGILVTSSIRDVSDRKRAETQELRTRISLQEQTENELRQSEERFRLLVEGVRDYAIFMLDPEGVVVSWNAGAERIFGFTREEAVGRRVVILHPPEELRAGIQQYALEEAAATGMFEEEGWRVRKDGRRFWANTTTTANLPQSTAMHNPCLHPRVQVVSRDEDSEFVECLECGQVFDSSEFKDMTIEETKLKEEF